MSKQHFPPLSPTLSQPLPKTTTPTKPTSPLSSSQPNSFYSIPRRTRLNFRSLQSNLNTPLNHHNKRPLSTSPNTSPITPPTKRKCSAPPKRSTLDIIPQNYKTIQKSSWLWPKSQKPTLVIGASNLTRITKSPSDQVEIHSYPGGRFQNFTDMLKRHDGKNVQNTKHIILHIGINDRASDPESTSIRNFKTMMGHVVDKFPNSSIHPVVINYSKKLSTLHRTNLDKLNAAIVQYPNVQSIPKLHDSYFKIDEHDRTGIHWNTESANAFLSHWISNLKSLN